MRNRKSDANNSDSPKSKNEPAVKLAIIGGIVTIAAALITSVLAPVVVELVKQAPIPSATDTSQLMPSSQVSLSQQVSVTGAPNLSSILTTTALPTDWKQIANFTVMGVTTALCQGVVIPPNIKPDQELNGAIQQVAKATNGEFDAWQWGSTDSDGIGLVLDVRSLVKVPNWIKLSNTIDVTVKTEQNLPERVNVLSGEGCGGVGSYRDFSNVSLASDYTTYSVKSSNSEFDFFTLQPGESEDFLLEFPCKSPGIYHLSFSLPFTYVGYSGKIDFQYNRGVVCPKLFTKWLSSGEAYISVENYNWNGQGYDLIP